MTQDLLFHELAVAVPDDNCHWYTPPHIAEIARQVMGTIDLDPCSCEEANRVIQARRYYSVERGENGLSLPWKAEVLWLNPPYGAVALWADKLIEAVDGGSVQDAMVLTNNCTDTEWWHKLADKALSVCFLRGRLKFWGPLQRSNSPTQGQTMFYFANNRGAYQ